MQPRTTQILKRARNGDEAASAELLEVVYDELRQLASAYMRRERPDHTLQATALVHEAYVNLVEASAVDWQDRAHFIGLAASVMRRVLVAHARRKNTRKRGGDHRRLPLEDTLALSANPELEFLDLDDALSRLAQRHERRARVVELRFFGGLSCDDVAQNLGISKKTVEADWYMARAWLHRELSRGHEP